MPISDEEKQKRGRLASDLFWKRAKEKELINKDGNIILTDDVLDLLSSCATEAGCFEGVFQDYDAAQEGIQ